MCFLLMVAQAHWSEEDVHALIDSLYTKHETSSDGGGTFKDPIWTEAVEHVNKVVPKILPKKGGPKTKGSCKGKWGKVSGLFQLRLGTDTVDS